MSYINANMNTIAMLANAIDSYEQRIKTLQDRLNGEFGSLKSNGQWTDVRHQEYAKESIAPINAELDALYSVLQNELRPYLREVYQRLQQYRDV